MSKGEKQLLEVLRKEFPGFVIKPQVTLHVGPKKALYVDALIPGLKLAFEIDGRQHDEFVPFFHKTQKKFRGAMLNDKAKLEALEYLGYVLIKFKENESITSGKVLEKIRRATINK